MLKINLQGLKSKFQNSKKGVSIIFAVFLLSFISLLAFGVSGILLRQVKIMREIGYSVVSFYAADSGVEAVLYEDRKLGPLPDNYSISASFNENGASYDVTFTRDAGVTTIKSIGGFKNASRAIEVQYQSQ